MAQETGFPPNELKNSTPCSNEFDMAFSRNYRPHRVAIAHWLSNHNHVGLNLDAGQSPKRHLRVFQIRFGLHR